MIGNGGAGGNGGVGANPGTGGIGAAGGNGGTLFGVPGTTAPTEPKRNPAIAGGNPRRWRRSDAVAVNSPPQ
ncbi:hypothetical protein I546_0303 [Mycobacterium kansasii 732]|nr:hypothetical protein I546_0303 [Mycobacterium kansasii 732]